MLRFLENPYNFVLTVLGGAFLAIILGGVLAPSPSIGQGGQPAYQGSAGSPSMFLVEVAKGNVPGHSVIHKFGKGLVGTTFVPIASSLKYPTPIAATALEVVSSDAADTAAGAGARSVSVTGLDADWNEITQTVATSGVTAVDLPIDMIRVYAWCVTASGTYATSTAGSHAGIITVQEDAAAALWFNGTITPYPKGQSEISGHTIPAGYTGYVFIQAVTADSTKSVDLMFIARENADDVTVPYSPMRSVKDFVGVTETPAAADFSIPLGPYPAKTDLIFMAVVASGTASVSVDYELILIKDGY